MASTLFPAPKSLGYDRSMRVAIPRCSAMPSESSAPQRLWEIPIMPRTRASTSRPVAVSVPAESALASFSASFTEGAADER